MLVFATSVLIVVEAGPLAAMAFLVTARWELESVIRGRALAHLSKFAGLRP